MKRSKAVFLLAPLALTACGESPQYGSMEQCAIAKTDSEFCQPKRTVSGGFNYVAVPTYSIAHRPSVRYGFVPGTARGGFGVSSRSFSFASFGS